ncbi:DUF2459 domain-containing protein [Aurantiacibacter suaedae]|uniref:DUF2459 domain-containing protein n=1 Tax=Aurantiacibacter suaedae TaxID=2545755 RepID=UPI001F4FC41B|nr:DUF2459 domain-containing protein [Aurantiacibacter suaedae]
MAQGALRRLARAIGRALVIVLLVLGAYPVAGWLGSTIPRGSGDGDQPREITIMVETNGTHTGVVVPVVNAVKDWRETFPSAARPRPHDGRLPTHLGIGWGEREVFLNVAEWSDLKLATAARIAFEGGEPLMRVSPYVRPMPSASYRPMTISAANYRKLVTRIEASLPPLASGEQREELRASYTSDTYYPALGTYTLFHTCNSWVGDTLAAAGIEMGAWTPFAGGVTKWIPVPGASADVAI